MSGRKNSLDNFKTTAAGDMSQATVTSTVSNIQFMDNIGIQVNILSGSPTGTFDVQISADHKEINQGGVPVVSVPGNWVSIGSAYQATITAGSPSNVYFDLNQLSAPYVRLLWTKTSGTGTFESYIVGKMI